MLMYFFCATTSNFHCQLLSLTPPSSPYSFFSYNFFPLPFQVQSLNLLEPKNPVCYVNGAYSNTLVPGRINLPSTALSSSLSFPHPTTLSLSLTHSPSHTHIGLYRAKLGFGAFGRRPTFSSSPQLRARWCSVYMNCQSQPNQKLTPVSCEQSGAKEVLYVSVWMFIFPCTVGILGDNFVNLSKTLYLINLAIVLFQ